MKILLETGLLFKRRMIEQFRSPIWLFMAFTNPLLYLLLFAPLLGGLPMVGSGGVANTFVPGLLVLFALNSGTGIAWQINHELQTGVTERLRVSPVNRFSLLMGNVLKDMVMFLITALLLIIVSSFAGFDIHLGGFLCNELKLNWLIGSVGLWNMKNY